MFYNSTLFDHSLLSLLLFPLPLKDRHSHLFSLNGIGRFAAALIEQNLNSWVMNVVPVSGPNTLPVIYDRGLLGVMHDWYVSQLFWIA